MTEQRIDDSVQNLIMMFNDCTKIEKIWKNASPKSEFVAQKLSFDTSKYDEIVVKFSADLSDLNVGGIEVICKKNQGSWGTMVIYGNKETNGYKNLFVAFRIFNVDESGVNFENAFYWSGGAYNGLANRSTRHLVPYEIFGRKLSGGGTT